MEQESISMLPSVLDFYQKNKAKWAKEGLTSEQQLQTAHHLNTVLTLIQHALVLGRYDVRHHNELAQTLDNYAKCHFNAPADRLRILGGAEHLLRQGDEALQKVCGWYETYPEVYMEKIAPNPAGLKLDRIRKFFQKDAVPNYSFLSFAKGENPAFSYHGKIWEKVVEVSALKKLDDNNIYKNWLEDSKSGKRYAYDRMVYGHALIDLTLQAQDCLGVEERSRKSHKQGR